jgi:hypothetical protein
MNRHEFFPHLADAVLDRCDLTTGSQPKLPQQRNSAAARGDTPGINHAALAFIENKR